MKAQERFNVRSAPWIKLGRPPIASGVAEGVVVALEGRDAETNNPRVLHVSMTPIEALDFAVRPIRASLKTQGADRAPDLNDTGRLLLQSQQAFLETILASTGTGDDVGQRMIRKELDRITEALATGLFLIE
jgi:hypothetical protein